jgi:hypothetical protein
MDEYEAMSVHEVVAWRRFMARQLGQLGQQDEQQDEES